MIKKSLYLNIITLSIFTSCGNQSPNNKYIDPPAQTYISHNKYRTNSNIEVKIDRTVEWDNGFCEDVQITNISDKTIQWRAELIIDGTINDIWSANYTQTDNLLIANGVSYNSELTANKSTTFGYCATKTIEVLANEISTDSSNLIMTKEMISQWNGGYCADIKLSNNSDLKIKWDISTTLDGKVFELWSANYAQDADLVLTASGVDYNKIIMPNSSIDFGYCLKDVPIKETVEEDEEIQQNDTTQTTQNDEPKSTIDYSSLFNDFNVGFGSSYAFPFLSSKGEKRIWVSSVELVMQDNIEDNTYYQDIKNFNANSFSNLQDKLKNSKFLVYWLVKDWKENWFNLQKIQTAMDAGYIPVFSYWYFADELMGGMPDADKKAKYQEDTIRFANFLKKLNGKKMVIMEPEFNKNVVLYNENTQHEFASIIAEAIDTIKAKNGDTIFSLSMMDTGNRGVKETYPKCDYENCALGDKYEWNRPEIVYNDLLPKLDFISFQENIGQFSRNPNDIHSPISYSNDEIGIDFLTTRINNFTRFLKEKYNKPVFLPFLTVASATWNDKNNDKAIEISELDYHGWDDKQEEIYRDLSQKKDILQDSGLFGYAPMSLFDDPKHDQYGYQFFLNNEYHLGIVGSDAIDSMDNAISGKLNFKKNVLEYIFG